MNTQRYQTFESRWWDEWEMSVNGDLFDLQNLDTHTLHYIWEQWGHVVPLEFKPWYRSKEKQISHREGCDEVMKGRRGWSCTMVILATTFLRVFFLRWKPLSFLSVCKKAVDRKFNLTWTDVRDRDRLTCNSALNSCTLPLEKSLASWDMMMMVGRVSDESFTWVCRSEEVEFWVYSWRWYCTGFTMDWDEVRWSGMGSRVSYVVCQQMQPQVRRFGLSDQARTGVVANWSRMRPPPKY